MQLQEVLAALGALPPELRKQVEEEAIEATKHLKFIPSPGPQTEGYFSEADITLFGGSPGGGKTALEIGLALNEHHRALIVRRNFTDLEGLIDTAKKLVGSEENFVGGPRPKYRKPDGGVIHFAGVGEGGLGGHQGVDHDLICVGRGTPILMADGSYKAIERIRAGDTVATLIGPRQVTRFIPKGIKRCARISVDGTETVVSVDHQILTETAWASPKELQSSGYRACEGKPSVFQRIRQALQRPFEWIQSGLALVLQPFVRKLAGIPFQASGALPASDRIGCARFDDEHQGVRQPEWWCGRVTLFARALRSVSQEIDAERHLRVQARGYDACGVRDSLRDCRDERDSCDAQPRPLAEDGPASIPSLDGAARFDLKVSHADDRVRTPSRSLVESLRFHHPYTKAEQVAVEPVLYHEAEISPAGEAEVFDLSVEEACHYVSYGGMIHRNCFDEVAQIPENPVRLMMGWLRTDREGQRCRVVMASNPPLDSTGDWLIDYFGPWLNETHPNPAKPGELRWYLPDDDGKDRECAKGDWAMVAGQKVYAQSRTFIPSRFTDNPFYDPQKYAASLAAVPEEFRGRLISGNFMMARRDQPHQVIPTAWIRAAQARWTSKPPTGVPMCAIGVDASGGGEDPMIMAARHDGWFAPLIETPGKDIPQDRIGPFCAGIVVSHRRDDALVTIDMGGGYGGSMHDHLKANGAEVAQYKGAEGTTKRSRDGKMKFTNVRSAACWIFREALDPAQEGGSPIALPPDPVLVADLTALTFEPTPNGIKVITKEKVCELLMRSTDRGDGVIMSWWTGPKAITHYSTWRADQRMNRNSPIKVNMGSRRK